MTSNNQESYEGGKPVVSYNPCIGMSSEGMSRFVMHLMEQLNAIREELKRVNETISSNTLEQQRLNALVLSLTEQFMSLVSPMRIRIAPSRICSLPSLPIGSNVLVGYRGFCHYG